MSIMKDKEKGRKKRGKVEGQKWEVEGQKKERKINE